jgi:chromosome segregation ATPase
MDILNKIIELFNIKALKRAYNSLETEYALLTDRYQKLTEEYEAIDANNERLIEGISDRNIQIENIRKEYDKVVADLETASKELDTLYALRDSLESQLKACKESKPPTVTTTDKAITADFKIPKSKK